MKLMSFLMSSKKVPRRVVILMSLSGMTGQCLVDALQAALVVEDVSEERILVCTFGLHMMSPFYGDYTMKLVGKED